MENSGTFGQVRCALTLEIREKKNSAGARQRSGDMALQRGEVPPEKRADLFDRASNIHRAGEWQPMVGAVAESCDLAFRIDHRFFRKSEDRSRCAKAYGDNS